MSTITTISKATHVVTYELSDNLISLNENSVVVIDRSKDDVVKITRNGNSAEIIFKNGDVIIIENYFNDNNDSDNEIVFKDDDGELYWAQFTNDKGGILNVVEYNFLESVDPLLYDEFNPGVLLPWVAGGTAVGGAAIISANNGENNNDDTVVITPKFPIVTENNKEGIEGTGDAGDTIVITDSEGNTVTTTVKPDGTWDIEPNPLNQGETGTIEAIDPSGNGSGEQPIKGGDQVAPDVPVVTENNKEGIEGTGDAGDTIVITDSEGNTVTTTVKPDGTWDIEPNPLNQGETGTIEAIDPSGNGSGEQPIKGGDQVAPNAPDAVINTDGTVVSGKAEPNSSIEVKDAAGKVIGTGTTDASGNFSVNVSPAVTDGQTATVTATDAAKNTSATDTVIGGKDTIAPNAPDAVINTDGTVVSGKAEPNSSIEVKDAAGKVIGTGTTDASGNFSVNVSPAVTDGQTATVTATDAAKNTSATDTVIGGKDTIAPNAPQLMLDEDTGIGGDGITSNGIINVSNLEENAIWQYSIDGGNTWKFGTGNSFMLAEGIYLQDLVQVKQTDLAGNSAITTMAPMVIDKTAPSLTIDDVLTNVSKPIITGTVEDGENPVTELTVKVEIRDAEGDLVETGAATVNADGSWSYIPKLDIADGNYFVEVSATDLANNTSTDTGGLAIDTTPPALLTIDFNDTGLFDDDGITSDGVIKLSNFEANSIWFYSLNGGNTWIQGEGKGFVIPEGVYVEDAIQIKQTDSFGNSTTQAIEVYKVDKTAPEFPTATLAFDTGSSATDGKTSNGLINVTDLESGSTWKYSLDGGLNWVEGTGTTFTLLDGSYTAGQIQIEQKDIAGNTSIFRLGEIIVDQTLSTPVLSIKDLGSNTSDNLTSDPKVYVSDIEAGSIWEYSLDGGQTWTLGTGNSFEAGLFGQNTSYSSNQIQVKQTDVYGNERIGKLSNAVTFDTLRHQLDMKLSDDSGSIKNDFITNNGEVTVSNLPIDLDYWQYSVNGSEFINGTGNSFVLPEGVYEDSDIQIVMFDKAGNKSAIWNAETWVVDTTPPVLKIDALPAGYITSSPVFEGTGNSGDIVTVTISSGSNPQLVTAIVDASGKWSVTSPKLDKGVYTVVASTEDLAGNTTTVVGSNKIIIDLPVGFTFDLSNDSGIYGDGITNDNNVGIGNLDTSKTWEYSIDGGKTWTN